MSAPATTHTYHLPFNLNDAVRVRLTDHGRALLKRQHDELSYHTEQRGGRPLVYVPPQEDAEGWSRWQAWDLFARLGPALGPGSEPMHMGIELVITISNRDAELDELAWNYYGMGGTKQYTYLKDALHELMLLRQACDHEEVTRMRRRLSDLEMKFDIIRRAVGSTASPT